MLVCWKAAQGDKSMKLKTIGMLAAGLVVAMPLAANAGSHGKKISLKFLTAWDDRYEGTQFIAYRYGEMLKKASNGRITMNFSGPEVVKFKQQLQPTARGVFDLNLSVGPYYFGTTSVMMAYFALPPDTELWRKKGYWQYADEEFKRFNLTQIAHPLGGSGADVFHMLLKEPLKKVEKPLAGRKLRGNIFYKPIIEPLGGSIVTLSGGEIYSALQKGVVEGAAWPVLGAVNFKWYEVTNYMSRPRFGASPYNVIMNSDSFKKLSSADQALMLKVGRDLELETPGVFDRATAKEIATLKEKGVKETFLDEEVNRKLTAGWKKGVWELALKNKKSNKRAKALYDMARKNGHAPAL